MLTDFLETNDIQALNQSIDATQIDRLKKNLKEEINAKQDQIHRLHGSKKQEITKIDQQTRKLIEQCEQFESKRQALIEQTEEYSKLEQQARHVNSDYHQIHRLNQFIHGLKQLTQLQRHLQECRQFCKQGDLNRAKTLFQSIESVTQDPYLFPSSVDRSSQDQYSFYETFQRSIRQLRSDITQMHTTLWNDGVDRQLKNEVKVTSNYLDRLFQCTFYEDKGEKSLIEKHVQTFATYCLQGFIHRLIEKRSELTIEDDERTLRLVYSLDSDQESSGNHRIEQFDRALNYLREFFQALHANLLSRTVKIQPANQKPVVSIMVMSLFSATIANDFIELIREHLLNLIPDDFQDVERFRALIENVMQLEQRLIEIKFFADSQISTVLSSVVGNIDEAIIKSRCRTYLIRSRELLQSKALLTTPLQTIEVGDDEQLFIQNEQEKENHKNQTQANLLTSSISLDELDANMFRFPRTVIVGHVQQYMELVRTVLQEAEQLDQYAAHLCATARNMIELFHVIYPSLHEKEAQESPRLTALHFNTYMYIAHQCLLLGEEYYHLKSKTADGQPITFVDFVPVFRNQAANLLKSQLDTQKNALTTFIRAIGAFHNIVDEDQSEDVLKRAVDQCTTQVQNLAHHWQSVFSPYVYFKVIGYLCDHVSYLLIKETVSLEDIPEQECQVMVTAFTRWSTFLQDLLVKDDRSPGLNILARLAPNLIRFNELCLVLNSPLQTIVDRWLNGQGPLASQFTAMEIKQLIRALFQTSERRTAALAKIQ